MLRRRERIPSESYCWATKVHPHLDQHAGPALPLNPPLLARGPARRSTLFTAALFLRFPLPGLGWLILCFALP